MTSNISYSKLCAETRRHHLALALVTYFFFFMRVVFFAMAIENYKDVNQVQLLENVRKGIQLDIVTAFGIILLAALNAGALFQHLHSRRKEDFYEALPVTREKLFLMQSVNALFIFFVPLFVSVVLECGIAASLHCLNGQLVLEAAAYLGMALLVFIGTWLTMALAMILTGNTIVGLLGFGVFAGYFPILIRTTIATYESMFFETYNSPGPLLDKCNYLSPVWLGISLQKTINVNGNERLIKYVAALFVWCVLLSVVCLFFYKKRPAEAAGRAMAFPGGNAVISVLLTVPLALYMGSMFYSLSMSNARVWLVFGTVVGVLLFHGIIAGIYHFDVRAFLAHKKQLAVVYGITFLFVAVFWFDLFGYDTYVPSENALASMKIMPQTVIEDGTMSASGIWSKPLTGEAMAKARKVVKTIAEEQKKGTGTESETEGNMGFLTYYLWAQVYVESPELTVTYHLDNGQTVKRNYEISGEKAMEAYSSLYATRAFKENCYYLYQISDVGEVKELTWSNGITSETLNLSKTEKKEFLDIYREEFATLSYKDLQEEMPVGSLSINYKDQEENAYTDETYYIYASFTKTQKFLAGKGLATNKNIKDLKIKSLKVTDYREEKAHGYEVTDAAVIESVREKLMPVLLFRGASEIGYEDVEILVTYEDGTEEGEVSCVTDSETAAKLE